MKLFSANLENLRELYIASLRKAVDMEDTIVSKGLPAMIEHTTDTELRTGFQQHLSESEGHLRQVKTLLNNIAGYDSSESCKAIHALVSEASDSIKDAGDEVVRDITLIYAGQQVEHHEIAVYGTLRTWAELLGLEEDADVLDAILEEEKLADEKLSSIADRVNTEASIAA